MRTTAPMDVGQAGSREVIRHCGLDGGGTGAVNRDRVRELVSWNHGVRVGGFRDRDRAIGAIASDRIGGSFPRVIIELWIGDAVRKLHTGGVTKRSCSCKSDGTCHLIDHKIVFLQSDGIAEIARHRRCTMLVTAPAPPDAPQTALPQAAKNIRDGGSAHRVWPQIGDLDGVLDGLARTDGAGRIARLQDHEVGHCRFHGWFVTIMGAARLTVAVHRAADHVSDPSQNHRGSLIAGLQHGRLEAPFLISPLRVVLEGGALDTHAGDEAAEDVDPAVHGGRGRDLKSNRQGRGAAPLFFFRIVNLDGIRTAVAAAVRRTPDRIDLVVQHRRGEKQTGRRHRRFLAP